MSVLFPKSLSVKEAQRRAAEPKPWELVVEDYLGGAQVLKDDMAKRLIERGDSNLRQDFEALQRSDRKRLSVPGLEAYRVDRHRGGYIVSTADGREPVASYGCGIMPYVAPAYRGRGICAHLHVYRDLTAGRMGAASYSREGFAARLRAHALHVEAALARGEDVPAPVRTQYRSTPEGLRLNVPYTAEDHNAHVSRLRDRRMRQKFHDITDGYVERYIDEARFTTGLAGRFGPGRAAGAAFAVRLAAAIEGDLRVSMIDARLCVQVEKDGLVHDILGVRAESQSHQDLLRREVFFDSDPVPEVFVFRHPDEIHDPSLRKEIEGMVRAGQESYAIEAEKIEAVLDAAQAFDHALEKAMTADPEF